MPIRYVGAFVSVCALLAAGGHGASARTLFATASSATKQTSAWASETGSASYYGPAYDGHRSASGAKFDQTALTAAHPWLPFGTKVRVMLMGSSRSVIVTITDRLHYAGRIVDLSVAAARELGMMSRGVAKVTLVPA